MNELFSGFKLTGLRARLLVIVLLAVVPLTLIFIGYASIENSRAEDLARTEVQRDLQSDANLLQDLVSQSRATLTTFGITYAIQARDWVLAQGNTDRLKAEHTEYSSIVVADPSGRVRVSSPHVTHPVDISGDASFQRAVATGGLVVSGYHIDPVTGRPAITVSLPAYDGRNKLVAVQYVAFDPKQFEARLTPSSRTVEVLIDGSGTVVARQPAFGPVAGRRLGEAALVKAMLADKQGTTTVTEADGVSRQFFFSPISANADQPLYLAVGFSPNELLAPERRAFTITLTAFGLVAIVVLVIAGIVGTYSIYVPTRQLQQAAEKVSEGDLSARVDLAGRTDELGALGREFNEMAAAIEHNVAQTEAARKELDSMNVTLEHQVRRRTAELEASNKELEAFSYSVSHDLRSPLRAIDGFSQALLEDHGAEIDREARDDLLRIRANATRMGELIDSLLTLSRLSRQEMHVEAFDLTALAVESVAAARQEWPQRDVAVEVEPGMTARGDPALIRIVLDNLLRNAFKFTSKHDPASVVVGSVRKDDETIFFVKDDGAGFDMAYAGKLFGAFQRVHGQAEFPGIGIGLATTARIVHRHGGRIWAEGEIEKGATFFFTL
jgi:signal transduction histidine kinase